MKSVFLIATLVCPKPTIIDLTKTNWSKNDQWVYDTAVKRCPEKYEHSPCLKLFIKKGYQDYKVICGN